MKHPLRILGAAGVLLTVAAFVADGMLRSEAAEAPAQATPPAFPVDMTGFGKAETAFTGGVQLVSYRVDTDAGGRKLRRPTVRVAGTDPQPEEGDWMLLKDVTITFYESSGETEAFRIRCPRGRVALERDSRRPSVDDSRPWQLEEPRLVSTTLLPGKELVLEAGVAELDAGTREIRSSGPFVARTEGFEIRGHELRADPEAGALLFGGAGEKGAVQWVLLRPDGTEFRGRSDGGGSFRPGPGDSRVLTLAAEEESVMEFPAESRLPGSLASRGMRLVIEPREEGWEPARAEGLVSSSWNGPAGWLRGGPWTGLWAGGEFAGFSVAGPLRGVFTDKRSAWVRARGGAFVAPVEGQGDRSSRGGEAVPPITVYLHGGAYMDDLHGRGRAAWMLYDPRELDVPGRSLDTSSGVSAGGGVYLETPYGLALCDRIEDFGRDGWRLEGAVVLYPAEGFGNAAGAPLVTLDPAGKLGMEGGFRLAGSADTGPWTLSGRSLESSRRHDLIRTRARGDIIWESQGAVFRGTEMLAVSAEIQSIELLGEPAVGLLADQEGVFTVRAWRMVLQEGALILSDRPELSLPAAVLGLEGGDLGVRAPRIRRDAAGAWALTGGVEFSGSLEGTARRVDWTPEQQMVLTGGPDPVRLAGRRADTGSFHLEGEVIRMDSEGGVELERAAVAELRGVTWGLQELSGGADRIRLEGRLARITPAGGWFQDAVVLDAGDLQGSAKRVEWTAVEGALQRISLLGRARLDSERAVGRARDIHYRPKGTMLRLDGTAEKLATLSLPDGRFVTGEWLELDLEEMLLAGGPGNTRHRNP